MKNSIIFYLKENSSSNSTYSTISRLGNVTLTLILRLLFPREFYLICELRKHETTIISKLLDRRTICSGHKRRCGWRIATLPVPGCGRVPTNTIYTRGIHSRVMEVHSGGFEKRCTCHLAAAPLIIMRRAYLPSDDGGPTWR